MSRLRYDTPTLGALDHGSVAAAELALMLLHASLSVRAGVYAAWRGCVEGHVSVTLQLH